MMENRNAFAAIVILAVVSISCWQGATKSSSNESPVEYVNSGKNINKPENKGNSNANMDEKKTAEGFEGNLPDGFKAPSDAVGRKLLKEYGSVFVARGGAVPPKTVVFRDESEVSSFQSSLQKSSESIGGSTMELQTVAMAGLKKAIEEGKAKNLKITPRDTDSARRTYNETVGLWASRVDPALKHWVSKGRIKQPDADKIKAMSPFEQVSEVLRLEEQGIYFAKDLSKSIIYSVAPPGTSQHLAMLAFDVTEHENSDVRTILANNGWFQTVSSDLPHFTFLGVKESELPGLGLKKINDGGRTFWVPDI